MSWNSPGWKAAAAEYCVNRPTVVAQNAPPNGTTRSAPETTVEAIMYFVRQRGIDALKEPANVERLSRSDGAALAEIKRRCGKAVPS